MRLFQIETVVEDVKRGEPENRALQKHCKNGTDQREMRGDVSVLHKKDGNALQETAHVKHGKSADVVPAVAVLATVMLLIERTCDTGDHRLFFVYGIMAANLYIIGHMAFALRKAAEE